MFQAPAVPHGATVAAAPQEEARSPGPAPPSLPNELVLTLSN